MITVELVMMERFPIPKGRYMLPGMSAQKHHTLGLPMKTEPYTGRDLKFIR